MYAFNEGDRVRYVGHTADWKGLEGVVTERFRDYDGTRIMVQLDGKDKPWSFDDEDFEPVRETYVIENAAEGFTTAVMDLTAAEVALIERMIEQFKDTHDEYAPTMTIKKEKKR